MKLKTMWKYRKLAKLWKHRMAIVGGAGVALGVASVLIVQKLGSGCESLPAGSAGGTKEPAALRQ